MPKTTATLCLLALAVSGCAAADRATTTADPYAYCAAVGTADTPGPPYQGERLPDDVATALRQAIGAAPDLPASTMSWRCMDGEVYGCAVGANLPCDAKADGSRAPSPAVRDYCTTTPEAAFVPAYVTGRATLFAWRCQGGQAEIVKQVATPDARGFLSEIWHPLTPPE